MGLKSELSAYDVSVDLGGSPVLKDISITLGAGQITAICGPNGAGKSTLLAALAGLLLPTRGTVELDEVVLQTMSPRTRARHLGYLPQAGEIAWDVAVESLIALGRLPHGDMDAEAIARAIAKADLADFAKRPISTLSGGEKARALLARVLAGEPDWIMADEPLAALDLAHQLAILQQLRSEASAGGGVVIVLHDLALAMNHADRVVVLDQGMLAACDAPNVALSVEVIAKVWGVPVHWLGEPGAMALATGS